MAEVSCESASTGFNEAQAEVETFRQYVRVHCHQHGFQSLSSDLILGRVEIRKCVADRFTRHSEDIQDCSTFAPCLIIRSDELTTIRSDNRAESVHRRMPVLRNLPLSCGSNFR